MQTEHSDNGRTGWISNETVLNVQNVPSLRILFSMPVDGQIYGQPLYVPQLAFPRFRLHNAVFVVTENDTVYAWDADVQGPFLWQRSLLGPGDHPLDVSDIEACPNISPKIGITSTPVIDAATNTIYVVAKLKNDRGRHDFSSIPSRARHLDWQ
jgi:hypothetical protein